MTTPPPRRPEVLAPAGDEQSLRAALAAGADAVYFGLSEGFNARAKTAGVSLGELPRVVAMCHLAGARAYVTLNTLLFESELALMEGLLRGVAAAGVDAIIAQDPAVALLARALCPTLEVHASTQMTVSSPEGAEFARGLGVTRVVVPRELSVSQIERFARESDMPLEVFIHGALCMSWSGQCLTSEAWGGRSANRGQCAQSCRMPYALVVDGEERPLGEIQYLLSPRDLAGFRAVESLARAGVVSLKIEGRYKGPAYVQQTVSAYQRWLDAVERGEADSPEAEERLRRDLTDLALTYSRGFSDGFLAGSDHQTLVEGRFPKHRGVFLGRVERVEGARVWAAGGGDGRVGSGGAALPPEARAGARGVVRDALPLLGGAPDATGPALAPVEPAPGMGVVFDAGAPEGDEAGGRLFGVERARGGWVLELASPEALRGVAPGQRVWVNHAPALARAAERAAEAPPLGRLPISVWVTGAAGAPLVARATHAHPSLALRLGGDPLVAVEVRSEVPLRAADGEGLTESLLRDKLCAFGQSPFRLEALSVTLEGALHLPVSALKALRRALAGALEGRLRAALPHQALPGSAVARVEAGLPPLEALAREAERSSPRHEPLLVPLCRTPEQLEAVIAAGFGEVELDWMEFVGLRQAVERARAFGLRVVIATVRVQKPGEEGYDRRVASLAPDGVLVRHWGALTHFARLARARAEEGAAAPTLHGDFSLNLTNSLSARHALSCGLSTFTASHDLDAAQLDALLRAVPPRRAAVTVHHHIPTFHTEHCVYAHLLSEGRDFRTCGRPCEAHRVALRDHKGLEHPVLVDVECRNTVFNASAQTAASLSASLLARGVGRLRVEFVWETRAQATRVLEGYQGLLSGALSAPQALRHIGAHEQFGLTAGTMQVQR